MKKLFKFFSMMVLIMMGQNAWAQGVEPVYTKVVWTGTQLNAIETGVSPSQFQKTTTDELVKVTIASDADVTFQSKRVVPLDSRNHLEFGFIFKNQQTNGTISWEAAQNGYKLQMRGVETVSMCAGGKCWYSLNGGAERQVNNNWITDDAFFDEDPGSAKFYFRGDPSRSGGDGPASSRAAMKQVGLYYQITPDVPEFVEGAEDSMFVTINHDNVRWYVLANQVKHNAAFEGTLKFDVKITKGQEKYMVWNEARTAFFMLKPMSFQIISRIEAKAGAYNAALDMDTLQITAKVPSDEPAQVFFYVDDELLWDTDTIPSVNGAKTYTDKFKVSDPNEHFVEYVYAPKVKDVTYDKQTVNSFYYNDKKKFPRYDYFYVKKELSEIENPQDTLTVYIDRARMSTLMLNAVGAEKHRVEFTLTDANHDSIFSSPDETAYWDKRWHKHENCIVFNYYLNGRTHRYADLKFLGVPDSLYFTYSNEATTYKDNTRLEISYSTTDSDTLVVLNPRIDGQPASAGENYKYALPEKANRVRFDYWGAANEGWVNNVRITEKKKLTVANDTILFDLTKRAPGQVMTMVDSLKWVNLAPRLYFTADAPFTPKSRIKVRLDEWNLNAGENKYRVELDRDTVGEFIDTMVISSMDSPDPILDTVILLAKVTYDTEDMFAKVNGQDRDTIKYGDTAVITIVDKLGTKLFKHDSLIVSYEYDSTKMSIDENGIVRNICVGSDTIIVKAEDNSFVPGGWADTLYIYVRENEKDSITFNFSSADEIAVHDTLTINVLDTNAVVEFSASQVDAVTKVNDTTFVIGSETYSDSLEIYVKTSQTCQHFENFDTIKVWVRGIVNPEFNANIKWMDDVFGNDTLVNPFVVLNEAKTDTINNLVNIAFTFDTTDIVVDSVEGQWYMRRSDDTDSLYIKAVVSGDSIRTDSVDIKFPVRWYNVNNFKFPTTKFDRGYYYVGDTMKVEEFSVFAKERNNKNLTNLVQWTKKFGDVADGTVLKDGSVILDSINTTSLEVCVDTLFVKKACDTYTFDVKPAIVKDLFFPGVDSIYVVGDSIAVRDIVVKDTADRDISRYVRYNFAYIPEDFAHNTGDSLNMFRDSVFTDFIVLDKNGLDTAAVDTVVSRTQGGLVTEKEFKDRLLIAPVYAVEVVWKDTVFTVGDTVRTDILTAYSGKDNDVTRYSSFIFVAADSIAERINDTTIVMKKAGQVMVKAVAKRNESMHQGKFSQVLTVNPIMLDSVAYGNTNLTVFDSYNTDSVRIFNKGRDITKYAELTFKYDGQCVWNGNRFMVEEAGKFPLTTYVGGNNVVADTLNQDIDVVKYANVAVVFDAAEFVVADSVSVSRFSLVDMTTGKEIDKKYYQFNYELLEENFDAEWISASAFIMDSLKANVKVSVDVAQKAIADFDTIVEVTAKPATADRVVFPDNAFMVGEGFAIADLQVFDIKNRDITRYAKNEFLVDQFTFNPDSRAGFNAAKDSIYFNNFGQVAITPVVGTLLVNEFSKKYMMGADQVKATRIVLPAGPYVVGNTLLAKDFQVFAGDKDVTSLIKDLSLNLNAEEGHAVEGGVMMDKKGQVVLTSEVIGRSNSENYVQLDTIEVEPVVAASFTVADKDYKVLDQIDLDSIKFFDAEGVDITRYVEPGYSWTPVASAQMGEGYIELDAAGTMTLYASIYGNAKTADGNALSLDIDVDTLQGAVIVLPTKTYVVGDTLKPADFYLQDAIGNRLNPRYGSFVLDIDPAFGHKDAATQTIIFDKAGSAPVTAKFDGEIVAPEFSEDLQVLQTKAETIVFPGNKTTFTVGDTVMISELTVLDAKGRDITRYAKNGWQYIVFNPILAGEGNVEEGYIVFNRPGTVVMNTGIGNDSIMFSYIKNTLYVDNLVATSIVLPDSNFVVGQTLKIKDVRVFAGDRDITDFSDIQLEIDEKDGYGHYTAAGVVFDKKGEVEIKATLAGFTGVAVMTAEKTYDVAPVAAVKVNLPQAAAVTDVINTANLIIYDADGNDINKYVEDVKYEFNNNFARLDANNNIVFDSVGTVVVIATVSGNAEGVIKDTIEVIPFTEAKIVFAKEGAVYHVADLLELRDFTLVDKNTNKIIYTDYTISINCAAEDGEKVEGGDIRFINVNSVKVEATVEGQVNIPAATFHVTVLPANAAYIIYPEDAEYKVGKSIAISEIQVMDSLNRNITEFLNVADFKEFVFTDDKGGYDAENIYFYKAGKTYVTATFGNKLVNTANITTLMSIDQIIADTITLDVNTFTVGDALMMSQVHVWDVDGNEITDLEDMFFLYNADEAHLIDGGIVFDDVNVKSITVGIKGYKNVVKAALSADVTVEAIEAYDFNGLNTNVTLYEQFDTKGITVVDAEGNAISYAEFDVTVENIDGAASINNGIITYEKVGQVNVIVTLTTDNVVVADGQQANFTKLVTIDQYTGAVVVAPAKEYMIGDTLTAADFKLMANGQDVTSLATLSISCMATEGTQVGEEIVLDQKLGNAAIQVAVSSSEFVMDPAMTSVTVVPCRAAKVVIPAADYKVGDSIAIDEIQIFNAAGMNITRFMVLDGADFSFAPANAAHVDGNYIILDVAGNIAIVTTVGSDFMMEGTFNNILTIAQEQEIEVTFAQYEFTVGQSMTMNDVTIFAGDKDMKAYADLSFSFAEGVAHMDGENLVFDQKGDPIVINVVVAGKAGVAEQVIPVEVKVNPLEAINFANLGSAYYVFDQFDTESITINAASGNVTDYAQFEVTLDNNDGVARLEDGIIYFDKEGTVDVVVTLTGENVIAGATYVPVQTVTVSKYEGARVIFPSNEYYIIGSTMNLNELSLVDENGEVIENAKITKFIIDADNEKDIEYISDEDTTQIKFINVATSVKVKVAIEGVVARTEDAKSYDVHPCKAADIVFPDVDVKATDSIKIADLVVKDAVNNDITRFVEYLDFQFEPAGSATYDMTTGYIYILKSGNIKVTTTIGGALVEGDSFTDRLGIYTTKATSIVLNPSEYIVGQTIDIKKTVVLDENGNDITNIAGQLLYVLPEGYAHFDDDHNIVVDKAGADYITVWVEGLGSVERINLVPELKVNPETAVSVEVKDNNISYYVFGGFSKDDLILRNAEGKDITNYAEFEVSFDPEANVKVDGNNYTFDKAGALNIKVTLTGNDVVGGPFENLSATIEPYQYATVIFPDAPEGGYHKNDIILKSDLKVVDAEGNDITNYAILNFLPTDGAQVTIDGDIQFTKAGTIEVKVSIAGDCKAETIIKEIEVSFYQAEIIIPAGPYYVGDTLPVVVMEGDSNVTAFVEKWTYSFSPTTAAKFDETNKQIILNEVGDVTVTLKAEGTGITDATYTATLHVRHIEDGCYDLLTQVWSDLLVVDNNNDNLPKFVRYAWYKDEYLIDGQTSQEFYARDIDRDGKAHIYYVRAYDAQGNEYLICEKEFTFEPKQISTARFMVYPTMMSTTEEYTVDADAAGEVIISNAAGNALDKFQVESGKNSVKAPAMLGVYVLRYRSVEGQEATKKLIVK